MSGYDRFELMRRAGARLAEIGAAHPEAEVPRYPGHSVTDLLRHTGQIHRRTSRIIREQLTERPQLDHAPDDDVPEWFTDGLLEMVAVLESADPVMTCWGFGPSPNVAFWTRRMAIETDVHRWDAESATGDPAPFRVEVAADGIDELQVMSLPWTQVTDPRRPGPVAAFAPQDVADTWTLVENDDGYQMVPGSLTEAVVSGPASDVLLALFGRPHGPLEETGPAEAHRHWRRIVDAMRDAAI